MPIVCLLFVCLCIRLFDSMLMFMLECITTIETLGNSFINTEKNWVTYQTWVILQLFNFYLTPHFKALHLRLSHNHNKKGIIWQKIWQSFWWYQACIDYYWAKRAICDQTQISKLFWGVFWPVCSNAVSKCSELKWLLTCYTSHGPIRHTIIYLSYDQTTKWLVTYCE